MREICNGWIAPADGTLLRFWHPVRTDAARRPLPTGFVGKRTDKSPSGNQLAHLQIPGSAHKLELTHSPDYEVKFPEDLVHTCIRVDDIIAYCEMLEGLNMDLDLWPGNWREKFADGKKMAFITDPDGYEVEVLEH